jgi:hypothetical protein
MDEGLPPLFTRSQVPADRLGTRVGASDEETLRGPAARQAAAEEPRRKDARVVDDEQVARAEDPGKIGDPSVPDVR